MALTQFGDKTKSLFLNEAESHKLHVAFEVKAAETIRRGQPVVLHTDGTIKPYVAGTSRDLIIGYSIHNGAAGDEITIACKGFAVVFAMSNAAIVPGPVTWSAMDAAGVAGFYSKYANTVVDAEGGLHAFMCGWAIDAADSADDLIRVILI